MAQISRIRIQNYRSIKDLSLNFSPNKPIILIGENNVGKSNIIKAIDLVLGEFWPGNYEPEENEFYNRDPNIPISIEIEFSKNLGRFKKIIWRYKPKEKDKKVSFIGLDNFNQEKWPRNEDRENLICITIGTDRRLSYQLSYSSKSTFLSKLMHQFHKSVQSNLATKSKLEEKFKEVKNLFHEITEFKSFRDSLRADFSDFMKTMTHKLDIDFEAYNPVNFFHALRLQVDEGGTPRTIEELGTGEEQILALAFAHAYAKAFHSGVLLAIEEPESNLHPLAQDYLAKKIHDMSKRGLHIIITTHSSSFINMLNIEGICIVRKDKNRGTYIAQGTKKQLIAYCVKHNVPANKITENNISEFYHVNANKQILEGFFSKKIILVEGPTEALALPIYLQAVGLVTQSEGISIIPVEGKGNIAKWWRIFTAYKIPVYIIFDNDEENDSEGTKRRDILRILGETETNINQLLKKDKILITNQYSIFGKDFETSLRTLFSEYSNLREEAKKVIEGESKPFIARYIAEKLFEQKSDQEGWKTLEALKEKIKDLSEPLGLDELNKGGDNNDNDILYDVEDIPF